MDKKILSLLMALCLVIGLCPAVSAAEVASGTCGGNSSWVLTDDGTLTISGTGEVYRAWDESKTWTAYKDLVTNVVIEEGITHIIEETFANHENMKYVSLPTTLSYLGRAAFSGSGLVSVSLPAGEFDLFDTFSHCESLESVSLKNTVLEGLYYAFSGCTNLKTVETDGAKVTEDTSLYYAFSDCVSLTDIDFYTRIEGMTRIGTSVFARCHGLKEITIPANITMLDYGAVYGDNLKTIIFEGDAPDLAFSQGYYEDDYGNLIPTTRSCFGGVSAKCYYPAGNETWTEESMINYDDGALTWIPYNPDNPFEDVRIGDFYYDPVMWALEQNITSGTTAATFDPFSACLRAHVVTFLWRAEGCPEPIAANNPFVDVKKTDFYYTAVLWAVEKGITTGADATHFNPMGVCNRAQVVTFLYRTFGAPAVDDSAGSFTDVPGDTWYTAPVLWAVREGITNGLSATEFGPVASCNRAQIVTFLYRAYTD